ncbi:radical SAM protein [Desulfovibrio sp. OttesenSCG-928-G15]|nr:radical SAM protein [Desulfovibrio sp. OttesenSCG-928-G15]
MAHIPDDPYFRPPSEAESFLVRVMRGCSHNRCTFCNMYKDIRLEITPLDEVLSGIDQDAEDLGEKNLHHVTSLYLEGGDPMVRKTDDLLKIMEHARLRFPHIKRVASYATARSIARKTPDELGRLFAAGLRRVHVGLESGLDQVLESTCKGSTAADYRHISRLLAQAGIENDVSIMLGIAGPEQSQQHAVATAALLSDIRPACVRIRTFVPNTDTPLGDDYLAGRFLLMGPHAILQELHVLVSYITAPMHLLSEFWSNFVFFDAMVPQAREELLLLIEETLRKPTTEFRQVGICSVKH